MGAASLNQPAAGEERPHLPRVLIRVIVILHSSGIRLTNVRSHPKRKWPH